jgi:hypothetical protein
LEPFHYYYTDPSAGDAQKYIVNHRLKNAELYTEGTVTYWKPIVGGSTLADTQPAVIIYRFPFDGTIKDGSLNMYASCYHWWYSQGHATLYASSDGQNWIKLAEAAPPVYGGASYAHFQGLFPTGLLHKSHLYLKAELFSYGERAPDGGVYTNTSQHSRYQHGSDIRTFELDVEFDEWIVGIAGIKTSYEDENGKSIIKDHLVPGKPSTIDVEIRNPTTNIVNAALGFILRTGPSQDHLKLIGTGTVVLETGSNKIITTTSTVHTPSYAAVGFRELEIVLKTEATDLDRYQDTVLVTKNKNITPAIDMLLLFTPQD